MKLPPVTIQLWVPFLLSIFLCGIVYANSLSEPLPGAFTTFFCFLPIVFFMVAAGTQIQFTKLEKRIAELEKNQ